MDHTATLLLSAGLSVAIAAVYAVVGRSVALRRVSEDAQLASDLFGVWWMALAGSTVTGGVLSLLGALGLASVPLVVTLTYLNLLAVCVALWGLLYYLLYLFTGRRGLIVPLSAFYVAYYAFLVYYVTASHPAGVDVSPWRVAIRYGDPLGGPVFAVVLILLVFPQILGALAYGTLIFRVEGASRRYRVALVSGSIVVWFGATFVGATLGLADTWTWWPVATRLIGLAAALTIFYAYHPPRWVRERLGVRPVPGAVRART